MFDLGLRIRQLREQHKLSQEELGRRVGRSKSVISSYENNLKLPPLDVLTQLARTFHVSLDYLAGIDKAEMLSLHRLSPSQKQIISLLLQEFLEQRPQPKGLSEQQDQIFRLLIREFANKWS